MSRRWKPSKTKAKEFAILMNEIEKYCEENNISKSSSSDSYYFTINNQDYRISNHSVEVSNYTNIFGEVQSYHGDSKTYRENVFCIHASKTRLIEIHEILKNGGKVNHKGEEIK